MAAANYERGLRLGSQLLDSSGRGNISSMVELITTGANLEVRDIFGQTPLMRAVRNDQLDAVNALLEAGANPNHIDNNGHTALMLAVQKKDLKMAEILLKAGADVNVRAREGSPTAVSLAFFWIPQVPWQAAAAANQLVLDPETGLYQLPAPPPPPAPVPDYDMIALLSQYGLDLTLDIYNFLTPQQKQEIVRRAAWKRRGTLKAFRNVQQERKFREYENRERNRGGRGAAEAGQGGRRTNRTLKTSRRKSSRRNRRGKSMKKN